MPEPISDANDPNKNVQPDPKEPVVSAPAPTLDQVHQISQAKVEAEDIEDAGKSDDKAEDPAKPDEPVVATKDESADEPVVVPPKPDEPAPDQPAVKPTVELDSDTLKPGAGKVAIKNAEGVVHYFNSLDEVPDDFEPVSYKALMVGTEALLEKKQTDAKNASDAADAAGKAEAKQRADDMQKSWEADAEALTTAGLLPKGDKAEAAKEEVYSYIEAEMKKGNIITSFNQAYKSMMYDKQEAKAAKEQEKINEAKKQRGATVQAGGTNGGANSGGTRTIVGPPAGASLDAVHAHALRNL